MRTPIHHQRCGHEIPAVDPQSQSCSVCDSEPGATTAEATIVFASVDSVVPREVTWILADGFAVCPICNASYESKERPEACEFCRRDDRYASTVWSLPRRYGSAALVLVHRETSARIVVQEGLVLGRSYTTCLAANPYVSRRHAIIHMEDGIPMVQDEGSANGTHVNGRKIARGTLVPLRAGDVLELDRQAFDVCVLE